MDLPSASQSHDFSQHANPISIPQLSPDLQDPDRYLFKAVVTLVWPFSSSNRLFSLLLAEPDFRLRNQNGQIRVTFCGRCAEEVALTKVGIGDTVTLSLQGAQWTENKKIQSTPGKSLSWELQFKNRLRFEATRNGAKIAALDIDRPTTPGENTLAAEPSTPALFNGIFATPTLSQERWETPAFLRTKRLLSRSPSQSSFDLLAEEDGYIPGKGRKRPRFSFPSSEWRLVDEQDSFTEDIPGNDDNWFESDEEKLDHDYGDDDSATRPLHEVETPEETSQTVPAGNATGGGTEFIESVESATQVLPRDTTYKGAGSLQIMASSQEEAFVEPSLQVTPLSSKTRRLDPITSPVIPTPSPLMSTPAEHSNYLHALPSSSTSVQPQFSHSAYNDFLSHDTHPDFTSDAHKEEPCYDVEVRGMNSHGLSIDGLDVESNLRPEYSEINAAANIDYGESSTRSSPLGVAAESPVLHEDHINTTINEPDQSKLLDYHHTDREDPVGINVGLVDGESGERQHIYETVSDAESLRDAQDIHEEEEGQIDGESSLLADNDEEGGSQYSESEEMIVEENSVNFQRIEVESLGSTGYRSRNGEVESYDSDSDGRSLSDDAEEDSEEIMSEEPETDIGSEAESDDEFSEESILEPEIPRRIVHPEVIVIDSDSEDEPPKRNGPLTMQERVPPNEPRTSSYFHGSDAHRYNDYMQEERDEYSGGEVEDNDAGALQGDTNLYNYERHIHDNPPVHDAYISDEETSYKDELQAENDEELETHSGGRDERAISQGSLSSSGRLAELEPINDTLHLDTMTPEVLSDRATPDNSFVGLGEQERGNSPGGKAMSAENLEAGVSVKEDQSLGSSQISGQEPYLNASRHMQRLVYRTASPKPVPTPPSTLNDESSYKIVGTQADVTAEHGSPASISDIIEPKTIADTRHHRWTDGSDEGTPQGFDDQSLNEETISPGIMDEYDDPPENLDEVVLIEGHSTQPDGVGRQLYNHEEPNLQPNLTTPDAPVRDLKVYPTLATLAGFLNKMVDIISVVVDISPTERATPASEEYYLRLRVTDISMAGTTIVVDIAGPRETSLLAMTEGDVVLLNNFEVQSLDGSLKLLSSNSSDWIIFRNTADVPHIMNPMITSSEHEHGYVRTLQNWYREDGAAMAADHMLQLSISQEDRDPSPFSVASSIAGSVDSGMTEPVSRPRPRRKKSHRRITIHELRDGRRYTEAGPQGGDLIHELRDGTVYAHSFGRD